jgi:hypothetical protein
MSKRTSPLPRGRRGPDEDVWQKNNGSESWIVVAGTDATTGGRTVRRCALYLPVSVAATGDWTSASDRVLPDILADLAHEQRRRAGTLPDLGGWSSTSTRRRSTK